MSGDEGHIFLDVPIRARAAHGGEADAVHLARRRRAATERRGLRCLRCASLAGSLFLLWLKNLAKLCARVQVDCAKNCAALAMPYTSYTNRDEKPYDDPDKWLSISHGGWIGPATDTVPVRVAKKIEAFVQSREPVLHIDEVLNNKKDVHQVRLLFQRLLEEKVPVQVFLWGAILQGDAAFAQLMRLLHECSVWSINLGELRFSEAQCAKLAETLKKSGDAHVLRVHGGGPVEGDVPPTIRDNRWKHGLGASAPTSRTTSCASRSRTGSTRRTTSATKTGRRATRAAGPRSSACSAGVRQVAPPPVHHRRLAARVLLRREHVGAAVSTPRPPPPRPRRRRRRPARRRPARPPPAPSHAHVPRAAATRRARRRRRSGSVTCLRRATR